MGCSTWGSFHRPLQRIRQIIVSSNYSNEEFDKQADILIGKNMLDTLHTENQIIKFMFIAKIHLLTLTVIKDIISANCTPGDNTKLVKVQIYYNSPTTLSLFIWNNLHSNKYKLTTPDVAYKYSYNTGDCVSQSMDYICTPIVLSVAELPNTFKQVTSNTTTCSTTELT